MKTSRFVLLLLIVVLVVASANAQNVVVQWNGIASTTIVTNGKETSVASGVWFAYVHLAVFDAVNAIDHRFHPYLFSAKPPGGANIDAAAVAAAHRILVNYFPVQQASLDAQYVLSLAAIPDTGTNIAAGEACGRGFGTSADQRARTRRLTCKCSVYAAGWPGLLPEDPARFRPAVDSLARPHGAFHHGQRRAILS